MSNTASNFKYYVLRTITGKEQEVGDYIRSMRDVEPLFRTNVRDILIPMETYFQVNKMAKEGKVERVRPYYSGYVFVEAWLVGDTTFKLRRVPNVLGFLGGEIDPVALSDADVAQLKETSDRLSEKPEDVELHFAVGERVKVTFGPFAGFFGEVTDVNDERKKLKILVKVFGRETMMEVDYMQVEKESLPDEAAQ